MSSQFSYELDERQIRLMMQDAELDYNEALWHKFDEMSLAQVRAGSSIISYIPTINFGISRSVIVPVIFIILIGGLSAMLFSFVDFKKKESIQNEIPYIANAEPTAIPKAKAKTVIKTTETPVLKVVTTIIDTTIKLATTNSIVPIPEVKKEGPAKIAESKPSSDKLVQQTVNPTANSKKETVTPRKKKRKIKTEALPIINTATVPNLNEGVSEPELDLK